MSKCETKNVITFSKSMIKIFIFLFLGVYFIENGCSAFCDLGMQICY